MPEAKTHHRAHKFFSPLAILAGAGYFWLVQPMTLQTGLCAVLIPLGYVIAYSVDPDLDHRAKARDVWGEIYVDIASILGGHRSFWTHMPVIGTLTRFLWFGLLWLSLLMMIGFLVHNSWDWIWPPVVGIFLGMCISDTVHLIMDLLIREK